MPNIICPARFLSLQLTEILGDLAHDDFEKFNKFFTQTLWELETVAF